MGKGNSILGRGLSNAKDLRVFGEVGEEEEQQGGVNRVGKNLEELNEMRHLGGQRPEPKGRVGQAPPLNLHIRKNKVFIKPK